MVNGDLSVGRRTPEHALWVLVASGTLTVMAGAVLGPVVNRIGTSLGVSQSLAGLVITTHGLFIVLTSPIAGTAIDRYGPRRPYVLGLVLYGIAGGAGLVVETFPALLVTRAVLGVAVAFVYTSITVLIYSLYEGTHKDRAMGLRGSANSLGAAVWPLVGGVLGTLSWQGPFGVYLLALPLGLVALLTVPEPARGSTRDADESGLAALHRVVGGTPVLLLVYALFSGTNLLLYGVVVYYPGVLSTVGVDSSLTISLYLSAMGTAGGVSAYYYDRITRRLSYRQLTLAAFGLWTVGFAVATAASSRVVALVPVVCFGLGQGLVFPTVLLWVEDLVPADRQGQFSSYVATFGYVGQFLAPVVFGPVAGAWGVRAVFGVAAAGAGLGVIGLGARLLR
ncbi:MFS transporter [Haloplanus natans]|uniref:MFS transporter n=1 Tax=Haloplanus natans TaxID=376171 RepID=UPI000677D3CC|nr:MFS transporter [Haloplanus natans]